MTTETICKTLTITLSGDVYLHELGPRDDQLTHLQRQVGGEMELSTLRPDLCLWVHEYGSLVYPRNFVLETMTRSLTTRPQPVFGPGVFTGGADEAGRTLGLTDGQIKFLLTLLAHAMHLSSFVD